jgi:hypothetical protein
MVITKLTSVLNNFHNIAKERISDFSKILLNLDLPRPLPYWQDKVQEWERSNISKLIDEFNEIELQFSISKMLEQNVVDRNRKAKETIETETLTMPKELTICELIKQGLDQIRDRRFRQTLHKT